MRRRAALRMVAPTRSRSRRSTLQRMAKARGLWDKGSPDALRDRLLRFDLGSGLTQEDFEGAPPGAAHAGANTGG